VLWILGALATLATIYSLYTSSMALAARVNDDRIETEALIYAALELTAYQVTPANAPSRPSRGSFSLHMGRADVQVGFTPEAGRIDLNEAPKEVLSGLFAALGTRKRDADNYADRIIGWRTRNQEADQEEEAAAYRVAGLAYKPRRAPFQSPSELWLVLGLPPTLVERILPLVTVYSGRPDLDMASAAPIAIAAQPGMTPEKLQGVLDGRAGAAASIRAPGVPPPAQGPAAPQKTFRIAVSIRFDNGRRVQAEAVILLIQDDEEPYHILSWHDDFDGPG
jgi:general secretion pathway protein K